ELAQEPDRAPGAGRGVDVEPFLLEDRPKDLQLADLVVHDEDPARLRRAPGAAHAAASDPAARCGPATGSSMRKLVPAPRTLVTSIRPPCSWRSRCVIASPSPTPASRVVKYGSKIRSRSGAAIPGPVSEIVIRTLGSPSPAGAHEAPVSSLPPPGIACSALTITLRKHVFSASGSALIGGRGPSRRRTTSTF